MYDNSPIGSSPQQCKRDLEAEEKRARKILDTFVNFHAGLKRFLESDCLYWIDDKEDKKSLLSIFGALSIKIPCKQAEYDKLLVEMENEQ